MKDNSLSVITCHFLEPPDTLEDRLSTANTEDSLISSRTSSETISSSVAEGNTIECCIATKKHKQKYGKIVSGILGLICIAWGISTIIITPFQLFQNERLRMRPGLPPFDWWKTPPDEVFFKAHIFNITNSEEFLNGIDAKLNVQEIGPIHFMEKLSHDNVTFNDNDTLTYTSTRKAIYLPKMNTINLNDTIIVPNMAVLGIASYLYDANFITKFGFNVLCRRLESKVFIKTTIYNYFWNASDPILDLMGSLAPGIIPTKNFGILQQIYEDFIDVVTVFIGTKHGDAKYFQIDKFRGSEFFPGSGMACAENITMTSEGVAYPQRTNKKSPLKYWRKTFCKPVSLTFEDEAERYGVHSLKFQLSNDTYRRKDSSEIDCNKGNPVLKNGLNDVSRCYFDIPMASSYPHFMHADQEVKDYVTGLKPNASLHNSFVYIEPFTGIPLVSKASSQSNLVIRKLSGFIEDINKFSDLAIPMFWIEYGQRGLPWKISTLLYFHVKLTPIFQKIFTSFLFILGTYLLTNCLKHYIKRKTTHLSLNKTINFEKESFLRKV